MPITSSIPRLRSAARRTVLALGLGIAASTLAADEPLKTGLYPLETCPISGKKMNAEGDPVIYEYKGRELRFSSKDCIKTFMKDPEGSLAKIDAAIIQQQLPGYPMVVCPVSGDKLGGEMGEPINRVYQNRLVRFCCPDCLKDFEKDPAKFLAKLDAAVIAQQKPSYPLTTCPVSGDKLEGEMGPPIDYIFAGRLVRFCCPKCLPDFAKDPWKFMAKVDEAAKGKGGNETAKAAYACPMKCEGAKTYDAPGKCPKCGMDLKKVDAKKDAHEEDEHHEHKH